MKQSLGLNLLIKHWWLVVSPDRCDVCLKDPGKDGDIYFSSTVRVMADVCMGDKSYKEALNSSELTVVGLINLTRNITQWLRPSIFVNAPGPLPNDEKEP